MDFAYALNALKEGKRVERTGWNGKNMFLFLQRGSNINMTGKPEGFPEPVFLDFIMMKTVQDEFVPWLASQTDILAEDWRIV